MRQVKAFEKRLPTPFLPPAVLFTEITEDVGLAFVHESGHADDHRMPEVLGGGAAVFDYDNDGDLNIYLINAGNPRPSSAGPNPAPNRLFRQESDGALTDVTEYVRSSAPRFTGASSGPAFRSRSTLSSQRSAWK